jgi:hypothetical protein
MKISARTNQRFSYTTGATSRWAFLVVIPFQQDQPWWSRSPSLREFVSLYHHASKFCVLLVISTVVWISTSLVLSEGGYIFCSLPLHQPICCSSAGPIYIWIPITTLPCTCAFHSKGDPRCDFHLSTVFDVAITPQLPFHVFLDHPADQLLPGC